MNETRLIYQVIAMDLDTGEMWRDHYQTAALLDTKTVWQDGPGIRPCWREPTDAEYVRLEQTLDDLGIEDD